MLPALEILPLQLHARIVGKLKIALGKLIAILYISRQQIRKTIAFTPIF